MTRPGEPPTSGAGARFVKCKGCNGIFIMFEDGSGAVGHSKPIELVGTRGAVKCDLFNRLDAEALRELHADAEQVPPPETFGPVKP